MIKVGWVSTQQLFSKKIKLGRDPAYLLCLLLMLCSPLPAQVRSGHTYLSPDLQQLQSDPFKNPASLWLEQGKTLFAPCEKCHQSMKGVVLKYPKLIDGKLQTLEARINQCRSEHLKEKPWAVESEALLSVMTYVGNASQGMPIQREIAAEIKPFWEAGKTLYTTRMGQLNLACGHCHDTLAGKRLLAETISQGHGNGYPSYRLEWAGMGSLERRLRACFQGVRAEAPAYGSPDLANLQLYLQTRSSGLTIETPAVRR